MSKNMDGSGYSLPLYRLDPDNGEAIDALWVTIFAMFGSAASFRVEIKTCGSRHHPTRHVFVRADDRDEMKRLTWWLNDNSRETWTPEQIVEANLAYWKWLEETTASQALEA